MDANPAIEHYRGRLLSLVMTLFAEIGLTEGAVVERLSKPLYRKVLRVLRTAESAVRRMIFEAARNIVVEPRKARPAKERKGPGKAERKSEGQRNDQRKRKRRFLFRLFDPPKRFKKFHHRRPKPRQAVPRIWAPDPPDPRAPIFRLFRQPPSPPAPPPPPVVEEEAIVDDGTVNAGPLIRRLFAIVDALRDIPRHAMRLALWQARPIEERRPKRWSPLRPGRPPGFRQRATHEVDEILKECDWLARLGHPPLDDTS